MSTKIVSLNDLKNKKNFILGYGHFSTIHPGHIRFLRYAKQKGQSLVVAVVDDLQESGLNKYQFTQKERVEALSLISMADAIYPLKGNQLKKVAEVIRPSVFLLGKEFEINPDPIVQRTINFLDGIKIPVEYYAGDIHYATTDLLTFSEREIYEKGKASFKYHAGVRTLNLKN